jgi:D-3-phosphoglycerate dehydrogenase
MIRRATAFGMPVAIWSRRFDGQDRPLASQEARELGLDDLDARAHLSVAPTPADVAARADAVSVHLALAPETRGLVGRAVIARLQRGAYIINTSRAEIVDAAALADAVREKGIRVALDVHASEPAGGTGELREAILDLPGVYGTHHIGASTEQAQEAIAAETVRIVRTFLETGRVPNVVNVATRTPATHRLIVRHRDRPGVLAHVFDHLRAAGLNVQETENIVFEGAEAAIARIDLDAAAPEGVLDAIRAGSRDVLDLRLVPIS